MSFSGPKQQLFHNGAPENFKTSESSDLQKSNEDSTSNVEDSFNLDLTLNSLTDDELNNIIRVLSLTNIDDNNKKAIISKSLHQFPQLTQAFLTKWQALCLNQISTSHFDFFTVLGSEIVTPMKQSEKNELVFTHKLGITYDNPLTLLRVFPLGIERIFGFGMFPFLQYHKGYEAYVIPDDIHSLELIIKDPSNTLAFIQIVYLEPLTEGLVATTLKNILSIPDSVALNGTINFQCEDDTIKPLEFSDVVFRIFYQYSLTSFYCQLRNYKNAFFIPSDRPDMDMFIDVIQNDKASLFLAMIKQIEGEHVFYPKAVKVSKILRNGPSFISLCAYYSAKDCLSELVNYYISHDLDYVHQKDNQERSPIHFACYAGDAGIVEFLLGIGEDLNAADKEQLKPIHYAMMHNTTTSLIPLFMKNNTDFFDTNNVNQVTPFHVACQYANIPMIEMYCEKIITIERYQQFLTTFCPNKLTPLHYTFLTKIECIGYFYSKRLYDSQFEFNPEFTPLDNALKNGNYEILEPLSILTEFDAKKYYPSPTSYYNAIKNGYSKIVEFYAPSLLQTPTIGWLVYCYMIQRGMSKILHALKLDPNENDTFEAFTRNLAIMENKRKRKEIPMSVNSVTRGNQPTLTPRTITELPYANEEELFNDSMGEPTELLPDSVYYYRLHTDQDAKTFTELTEFSFPTVESVIRAVQNISLIQNIDFSIARSDAFKRIQFGCHNKKCAFRMLWKFHTNLKTWKILEFTDHSCNGEKPARVHHHMIDYIIKSYSLNRYDFKTALDMAQNIIKEIQPQSFRDRFNKFPAESKGDYFWQRAPSFLDNNEQNGGVSSLKLSIDRQVESMGQLPQYAKLLFQYNAVLPVVILNETNLFTSYPGNLVSAMVVSSNRTVIPIAWGWSKPDHPELYGVVLQLIQKVQPNISAVISSQSDEIKKYVEQVFPKAKHHLSSYYVFQKLKNPQLKKAFLHLLKADHPAQFILTLQKLLKAFPDESAKLKNLQFTSFLRFFEKCHINEAIKVHPCELLNTEIIPFLSRHPLEIFEQLELIGFDRCVGLRVLKTPKTPYYDKHYLHLTQKVPDLHILQESKREFCREIFDVKLNEVINKNVPAPKRITLKFMVCTEDSQCNCGRYADRGIPCVHFFKVCEEMHIPFERFVHPSYKTETLKKALTDLHFPFRIDVTTTDETINFLPPLPPPPIRAHPRSAKTTAPPNDTNPTARYITTTPSTTATTTTTATTSTIATTTTTAPAPTTATTSTAASTATAPTTASPSSE